MTESEDAFSKQLGRRIAQFRKEQGLTQQQLADVLDLKQYVIANYETGRYRVPVVAVPKLATALGVSVEELLGGGAHSKKRGPSARLQQQIEQLTRLPRSKQKFVSEFLDTVLQQTGS